MNTQETILLDPDLFMALGLSAEAHGGIGACFLFESGSPYCVHGHALWIKDTIDGRSQELYDAGLTVGRNDRALLPTNDRVPFKRWLQLVNVDVKET